MRHEDQRRMTTEGCSSAVDGSPDSGMEEDLASSLTSLFLDSDENPDSSGEGGCHTPAPSRAPVKVGSTTRAMSISSEETTPSGAEDLEPGADGQLSREERVATIRDMLETYFSDSYLTRDIFLLKHFRRSKEGWISLKFMAAYKKIKRTTKCLEEVQEAARESPLLEVSAEGNKVRRLAPLPACIDEYIPTRMVLVGELPPHLRNLTALSKHLARHGSVVSIQLLRPNATLSEILQETAQKFPKVREQWCALIEFDEISAVEQLMETASGELGEGGVGWALELVTPWRSGKPTDQTTSLNKNRCWSSPSSGYSSPCLTPDQSPSVAGRRCSPRGFTKRERILMQEAAHRRSYVSQIASSSPLTPSRKVFRRDNHVVESPSPSPRQTRKLTEASRNVNWRAPWPLHPC